MPNTWTSKQSATIEEAGGEIVFTPETCGYQLNTSHASHVIFLQDIATNDQMDFSVLLEDSDGPTWVIVHKNIRSTPEGTAVWNITPYAGGLHAGGLSDTTRTTHTSVSGRFAGFKISALTTAESVKGTINSTASGV